MMVSGLLAAALVLFAAPARAEGDTYRQDGATIRLVALAPDADGEVRGALSIDLEPGWKTYWIAPGPVGLAPRLDFSGSAGLSDPVVSFPVPVRFAEGEAQSVGYAEPVAFPISAKAVPGASPTMRVTAVLGLCRELCVPVQASLSAGASGSLSDRALVRRADESLPSQADGPPPVVRWSADRQALLVDVAESRPMPTDAFASAGDGWSFGRAVPSPNGGGRTLSLPVLTRPSPRAELSSVDLLLTRAESAQLSRAVTIAPQ